MGELQSLPNIADKLEAQLIEVGVGGIDALKQTGSREAWLRIAAIDPSACYMRLCALEGAIQGVRWHHLDEETKKRPQEFLQRAKRQIGKIQAGQSLLRLFSSEDESLSVFMRNPKQLKQYKAMIIPPVAIH